MEQSIQLTAIDLFAGIGGFHLAAQELGIKVNFASEINPVAQETYAANLKLKPYGDIKQHINDVPNHDILMAGFPCQSFSTLGKGRGLEDPRGELIYEIVKIAELRRPRAIVLENVRQLAFHKQGETFKTIRQLFTNLGYDIQYKILNSLHYGLPQYRRRMMIVGFLDVNPPLFWPTYAGAHKSLADVLETNVSSEYFATPEFKARCRANMHPKYLPYRKGKDPSILNNYSPWPAPVIWRAYRTIHPRECYPYATSLISDGSRKYALVNGERFLTEREMLRLQGFPDWYSINYDYNRAMYITGNAIPIPMAKIALQYVKNTLEQN